MPVLRDVRIDFNMKDTPLEIKTDSELNSGDGVNVFLYSSKGEIAGGIRLLFNYTAVRYWFFHCSRDWHDLPTNPPSDRIKIWRIALDRSLGVTVVIHCNGIEVLRVRLSGDVCDDWHWNSLWSVPWSREVKMIRFSKLFDDASDFYRAQPKLGN